MEEEAVSAPSIPIAPVLTVCSQCHQVILPTYYFCPNCGKKLNEAPLSTSLSSQILLYAFSVVLPSICYLAIGYWRGIKYLESADPKAKQIGIIALALLLVSSAITFWIGIVWIQNMLQSAMTSVGSINGYMNSL
jgi:hypothetical protein